MQTGAFLDLVAWALIIVGVFIIISGIASMLMGSDVEGMGPIPIVWGYGKKVWIIAAIVAITLFLIVFVGFP